MRFSDERGVQRWFIIISSLAIIILIVWNAVLFFQQLKEDERRKMNIWASAQISLAQASEDTNLDPLILTVINSNTTIPTILVKGSGDIADMLNIPAEIKNDDQKVERYLQRLKSENEPIEMDTGSGTIQQVYYGNSPLLNKLKYYPLVLIVIMMLFIAVIYFFYKTTKSSEQNKLWAGMAKETAHQIGTPLSSLIGWTEILKEENTNPDYIAEIQKDVDRLKTITERFSKIGSAPTLHPVDIVEQTQITFDYLKLRTSKLIEFHLELPEHPIEVNLNEQLYSWTIENLVKNAIDAMRGKGSLSMEVKPNSRTVHIFIKDTGKGMPKSKFKEVFEPGFTTKKRGWGLGLSLSKRIIEKYHRGKIRVCQSEIGKGTTFEIVLPKV